MTFHFNKTYFTLALLAFIAETLIALFVNDQIIRPFVGDVLVVALVYFFASIFLRFDRRKIAFGAFIFACVIEVLQYFDYVKLLGLESNRILSVMMGRTFEYTDFAAYFLGLLLILLFEKIFRQRIYD